LSVAFFAETAAAPEAAEGSRRSVHDEFNGAPKVSPINRAIMNIGFDRLRPTAAPGAAGLCAIGLLVACSTATTAGGDASLWDGDARSAVRLIAGSAPTDRNAPLRAGVEIRLKAGWHTYWRYPGDAGVPPHFDFTGSQNLKSAEVRWPAPQSIPEHGLVVIGYAGRVILPLTVVPRDRAKPVTLKLKLDYAVCEKLCVPAEGRAELSLAGDRSSHDVALTAAEDRVPRKLALGEGAALAVKSVRREGDPARPRVIVDVAAPAGAAVALFAEGPTPDWALPVPAAVAGAPAGRHRFAFDLDGAPPSSSLAGARITLTAVAGDEAIEVVTRLD
jgi:DsbC/DsbD-like thiol-disulfide interchange protein